MVLIFTHRIASRSKYTFKLFGAIIGLEFRLTTDKDEFISFAGPKFSYTKQPLGDELFFNSTWLLFETGIVVQELTFQSWEGMKVFYPTHRKSILPFDPFGSAFFLISRYEEYLPHIKDQHGRYESRQSVASLNNFLHRPVINIWAIEILRLIEERFGKQKRSNRKYSFVPTIDIDNAWAYQNKGFIRAGGGLLGDLINLNFKLFAERFKVVFRLKTDPYDTYDYHMELIEKYNLRPVYFFLMGDFGPFDRNVPYQNKHFQSLIKFCADFGSVVIHPSYASNEQPGKLKKEINRLSQILHQEVSASRQHFLRLSLPETYSNLIDADITDDYTMGYADQPGFRAGICTPFLFYDLDLEVETPLRVNPFAIMDGTLRDYMGVPAESAMQIIQPLINEVKAVNGNFISIWHNESFAGNSRWKGWRKVYEDLINAAVD